jgi:OOP family OmpA-OmpF porin
MVLPALAATLIAPHASADEAVDPYFFRHRPTPLALEAGVYFGMAWFSSDHNLQDLSKVGPRNPHQTINNAPSVGLRVGFFPLTFAGAELEGGVIPSHTPDTQSATIWTLRGHAVAQLPLAHIVPFAYFGGGMMSLVSDPLGHDTDPVTYFGAGVKLAISQYLSFRLDARDNLMQKNRLIAGTQNGDLVHNGEILASALFTLGRTPWPEHPPAPPPPDQDKDGVPDDVDRCPTVPGTAPTGCPPEPDRDSDDIPDPSDKCPDEPEDGRPPDPLDGCPAPPPPPEEKPKDEAPPPPPPSSESTDQRGG